MRQYLGDFLVAGVVAFTLTITGVSIDNQSPISPPIVGENVDSIVIDTRVKTQEIKKLLLPSSQKDTVVSKVKKK
jgi:hypothetical protein